MTRTYEERITNAIEAVTAGVSRRWALKQYHIDYTTLLHYINGKLTRKEARELQQVLTPIEELFIVFITALEH